jgi:hypothetical protein
MGDKRKGDPFVIARGESLDVIYCLAVTDRREYEIPVRLCKWDGARGWSKLEDIDPWNGPELSCMLKTDPFGAVWNVFREEIIQQVRGDSCIVWHLPTGELNHIGSVGFDREGNAYIVGSGDHVLRKRGRAFDQIKLPSQAELLAVTFDESGRLWVCGNETVLCLDQGTSKQFTFPEELLIDIACGKGDVVYVCSKFGDVWVSHVHDGPSSNTEPRFEKCPAFSEHFGFDTQLMCNLVVDTDALLAQADGMIVRFSQDVGWSRVSPDWMYVTDYVHFGGEMAVACDHDQRIWRGPDWRQLPALPEEWFGESLY